MEFFEIMDRAREGAAIKRPYMDFPLVVFDIFEHDYKDEIPVPRHGNTSDIPGWFPSVMCKADYNFPEKDIAATDWEVVDG